MAINAALETVLRTRRLAKLERERQQRKLIDDEPIFAETIAGKLDGLASGNQWWNFQRCGNETIYKTCKCCGEVTEFPYRCSLKWCPRCQWWLLERRKKALQLWASRVTQPKHLILTQANFPIITQRKIREHTRDLARMRRTKCMRQVKGGCVSVEMTRNETDWHLHSHWLIDVRWLDMEAVSQAWANLVGQEFAIVKIKDVRQREYLNEVTKYVATGSEVASWSGAHIWEFISAVRGRRFFFPFGSLFKMGPAIRAELKLLAGPPGVCGCGSDEFTYETEEQVIMHDYAQLTKHKRRR